MADITVNLIAPLDEDKEEKTKVFAALEGAPQSEFFGAAQSGFKAQYKISVWTHEYQGQSIVEFGGVRYSVYRTYPRKDYKTELYLTDRVGARYGQY